MELENMNIFLDNVFAELANFSINISNYELDHVAYQCSSVKDYDKRKLEFTKLGKLIDENLVGGRRVGIIKLKSPIQYNDYLIPVLEIIEPKTGYIHPSDLEHVEFVIEEDFKEFMNKYPNIDWDTSAIDQHKFHMIKLRLSENIQVKFHYEHILKIIKDK